MKAWGLETGCAFAIGTQVISGFVSGCPRGQSDGFWLFSCLRERVQLKKCWRVCSIRSHMLFPPHARRRTVSLGVKLRRGQPPQLAGSRSSLPGLLKMSLPIKVTGIFKVTGNAVTCAGCQQTKPRAGTGLPAPLQLPSAFTAQPQ